MQLVLTPRQPPLGNLAHYGSIGTVRCSDWLAWDKTVTPSDDLARAYALAISSWVDGYIAGFDVGSAVTASADGTSSRLPDVDRQRELWGHGKIAATAKFYCQTHPTATIQEAANAAYVVLPR